MIFCYMIISTISHFVTHRRMRRFTIRVKSVPGGPEKTSGRPVGLDGNRNKRTFYHSDKHFADGIRTIIRENQDGQDD